uniref:Uncharacterized protein n=1 Tax=Fagus sylvatica TaxID=28930 RepID=A0A2N9IVN3_FAGSY
MLIQDSLKVGCGARRLYWAIDYVRQGASSKLKANLEEATAQAQAHKKVAEGLKAEKGSLRSQIKQLEADVKRKDELISALETGRDELLHKTEALQGRSQMQRRRPRQQPWRKTVRMRREKTWFNLSAIRSCMVRTWLKEPTSDVPSSTPDGPQGDDSAVGPVGGQTVSVDDQTNPPPAGDEVQ